MNPEKRRARAKHEKYLHNLEVAYKQRKKGKRFVLKKLDTAVKEVVGGANSEGQEDFKENEPDIQPQESEAGVRGNDPGEEVNRS